MCLGFKLCLLVLVVFVLRLGVGVLVVCFVFGLVGWCFVMFWSCYGLLGFGCCLVDFELFCLLLVWMLFVWLWVCLCV